MAELKYHQRRRELCRICESVRNFSCGTPRCPLAYPCEVFGNPHTTDVESVKAIYRIYQHEKNKKSES